jgi:hypothetical protein
MSIDTRQPYPGGKLGGKRWSRAFTHYISGALPRSIAEGDRELREWWTTDYGRARVARGFLARYGDRTTRDGRSLAEVAWEAVLTLLYSPIPHDTAWQEIAARYGKSPQWLSAQVRMAYRYAYSRQPIDALHPNGQDTQAA